MKEIEIPEGYEARIEGNKVVFIQKESEDERIRKSLLGQYKGFKQADFYDDGITFGDVVSWLEKQKEQEPAEWSEDWREEDIQTRFAFYTYKDDPSVLYLSNVFVEETSRNHGFGTRILKAAEKAAEAIGAITICLKVKQDSPENAWYRKHGYGYVAFEDGYDWLEKNLEYLKPAKPVEWSEEDDKKRKCLIKGLEDRMGFNWTTQAYNREQLIDWLKSLRPSFKDREMKLKILKYLSTRCSVLEFEEVETYLNNLRPSWKPSKKQIGALENVRYMMSQSEDYYDTVQILDSLINDLKKLF